MPRTTPELVGKVIRVRETDDLTAYISAAAILVNRFCVPSGYPEDHLTEIETWLAAHFYDVNNPRSFQESVSTVFETKERIAVDLYLDVTKYGQQAIVLDVAGQLAAYNNALKSVKKVPDGVRVKPGVVWLGTRCCPRRYYGRY